ncbi:MAG: glycosyltransferase, partial [Lachnospiraceae bacterium]|nr:glycosyltransferase [Lachnospiraceae bacterium]
PRFVSRIKEVLTNQDKRVVIADAGRKKALENHTWDIRARELSEIIWGE